MVNQSCFLLLGLWFDLNGGWRPKRHLVDLYVLWDVCRIFEQWLNHYTQTLLVTVLFEYIHPWQLTFYQGMNVTQERKLQMKQMCIEWLKRANLFHKSHIQCLNCLVSYFWSEYHSVVQMFMLLQQKNQEKEKAFFSSTRIRQHWPSPFNRAHFCISKQYVATEPKNMINISCLDMQIPLLNKKGFFVMYWLIFCDVPAFLIIFFRSRSVVMYITQWVIYYNILCSTNAFSCSWPTNKK